MPAHYHLNHLFNGNSTDHDHVIDYHLIVDKTDQSLHGEYTAVFTANPDGIIKKSKPEFFPFILLAILLVLITIHNKRISIRLECSNVSLKQRYQFLIPPLRAPPLH